MKSNRYCCQGKRQRAPALLCRCPFTSDLSSQRCHSSTDQSATDFIFSYKHTLISTPTPKLPSSYKNSAEIFIETIKTQKLILRSSSLSYLAHPHLLIHLLTKTPTKHIWVTSRDRLFNAYSTTISSPPTSHDGLQFSFIVNFLYLVG